MADVMFNSTLVYRIVYIKKFAIKELEKNTASSSPSIFRSL